MYSCNNQAFLTETGLLGIIGFVKSMKPLEEYEGIKIVTILPGAVDSPLLNEEQRTKTGYDKIEKLSTDEVAKAMIDLVRKIVAYILLHLADPI